MKKGIAFALVFVALLVASAYYNLAGKEYVIRIPESDLQSKLSSKLPITKSFFLVIRVTLSNPRVSLENGSNRVRAGLDVELNIGVENSSKPLGGSVDISGGVAYVSEDGEFFLTDAKIDQLELQGIPSRYVDKVDNALTHALAEFYRDHPIYSLSSLDAKQAAAKLVLRDVVVHNKELVITLGI